MNSKEFAQQYLLLEVEKMKAADVRLHLLSAMVHGIETAGALLDTMPFKAKGQGKKRFVLALNRLFPSIYMEAGMKLDLYGLLRSHMSHCMLPAKQIHVSDELQHLHYSDEVMNISIESFYRDYHRAITDLVGQLETGRLKNKKIQFDNLDPIKK